MRRRKRERETHTGYQYIKKKICKLNNYQLDHQINNPESQFTWLFFLGNIRLLCIRVLLSLYKTHTRPGKLFSPFILSHLNQTQQVGYEYPTLEPLLIASWFLNTKHQFLCLKILGLPKFPWGFRVIIICQSLSLVCRDCEGGRLRGREGMLYFLLDFCFTKRWNADFCDTVQKPHHPFVALYLGEDGCGGRV